MLIELWRRVRRPFLIGFVGSVALIAVLYPFVPRVYNAETWITPGYLPDEPKIRAGLDGESGDPAIIYIEAPASIVLRLTRDNQLPHRYWFSRDEPWVQRVKVDWKRKTKAIQIVTSGRTPESAENYLRKVVDSILSEQGRAYEQYVSQRRAQLADLTQYHEILRDKFRAAGGKSIDFPWAAKTATHAYSLELMILAREMRDVLDRQALLERFLMPAYCAPAAYLTPPVATSTPAMPHPRLAAVSAILIGLLMGGMAAAVRVYWGAERRGH